MVRSVVDHRGCAREQVAQPAQEEPIRQRYRKRVAQLGGRIFEGRRPFVEAAKRGTTEGREAGEVEHVVRVHEAGKQGPAVEVDLGSASRHRTGRSDRRHPALREEQVTKLVVVRRADPVPAPGKPAPSVHTPTADEVANIQEIDTRIPPDTMHEVDFADALGDRAIVLLFATPALCQSRVCGPVVDIAEQVHRDYADKDVAFIHMEVYEDNAVENGIRPQLEAFGLQTEPWLFVVDERGMVTTALEGGFSVAELSSAVEKALG